MPLKFIILGVVIAFAVAIGAEAYLRRNRVPKTLVQRFKPNHDTNIDETKPELGMEATDMKIVLDAERTNANIELRNRSLRRR